MNPVTIDFTTEMAASFSYWSYSNNLGFLMFIFKPDMIKQL